MTTASEEDLEGDALDWLQHEQLKAVLWECVDSLTWAAAGSDPEAVLGQHEHERGQKGIRCFL